MKTRLFMLSLLLILPLVLSGCQAGSGTYLGTTAPPELRLSLANVNSGVQHWQDLYLDISYRLQRQDSGQLAIEGDFGFANYPQINLARAKQVTLKLFMLNDQNQVIDYFDLSTVIGVDLEGRHGFQNLIPANPKMASLAFGYDGTLLDENMGSKLIWKFPLHKS